MTAKGDYYDILGVSKSASADEIKKAFRKKAKLVHPDTNDSPNAAEEFKQLGEAYDVLSDSQKRQLYDTYGHDGLKAGGYSPSWDFVQGMPDLGDLFSSFFGGQGGFRGGGGRRSGPIEGDDLQVALAITFEEACFGVTKSLTYDRLEHCEDCKGTGSANSAAPKACHVCQGQGQVRQSTQTFIGHFMQIVTCPNCQGSGEMIADPCKTCHGKALTPKSHTVEIPIPAGVDDGNQVRLSQKGHAGLRGGPHGHVYVVLQVSPHASFVRKGNLIESRIAVTFPQLVLGTEVEVPTLDGPVKLKIPAGTASGTEFTLKNHGVPILNTQGSRGHHRVAVDVAVPKHPTGEERRLLEQLQSLYNPAPASHKKKASAADSPSGQTVHHHSFVDKVKDVLSGHL
jgi:molecular chaperone DnaJ